MRQLHVSTKLKLRRNLEILWLRNSGLTLKAIADKYGVYPEGIRQIVSKTERIVKYHGLNPDFDEPSSEP